MIAEHITNLETNPTKEAVEEARRFWDIYEQWEPVDQMDCSVVCSIMCKIRDYFSLLRYCRRNLVTLIFKVGGKQCDRGWYVTCCRMFVTRALCTMVKRTTGLVGVPVIPNARAVLTELYDKTLENVKVTL